MRGGGGGGGGGSEPTPLKTSPALSPEVNAQRRASNRARGVGDAQGRSPSDPGYGSGSSRTESTSAKVELAAAPTQTPTTAARATHDFRSGRGASIVSGKPAGFALVKQQYISDILEQSAQMQKQKVDQDFLRRPGPTGLGPGTVSPPKKTYEPTARGGLEKAKDYFSKKSAALEGQASTKRARGKSGVGVAAAGFGMSLVAGSLGMVSTIAHPVRTAKGLYRVVRRPMAAGAQAGEALATRPVQTTGETIGAVATAYGASKVVGAGIKQVRKLKPAEVKSFEVSKAHIKTKEVVPGLESVKRSSIEQTAKGRVKVGSKEYAVKSTGRAKAITGPGGKSLTTGKIKHGITDVTKITKKGLGKFRKGGARFVSEAERTGDKAKSATVQQTAVEIKPGKTFARAQDVSVSKGAKVLEAERGISLTTQTKKGAKTVRPMAVEQWQYKTKTRTTKVQQVSKTGAKLRKIKPLTPAQAEEILSKKRPTSVSVTTQRRVKGLEVTRQQFDKRTPAVYTKTTSTEIIKGKTVARSIPKKPVVKPLVKQTGRAAGRAARTAKQTTAKMLQSKKASLAESRYRPGQPRHTDVFPKTPSDLRPTRAITKPAAKVKVVTSLPELQQALYDSARTAARLTYIYKPVTGGGALTAGLSGAAVVSKTKLPAAIKIKPLESVKVSPLDRTRPGVETQPKTEPITFPILRTVPELKITVVPDVTYPPAISPPLAPPPTITTPGLRIPPPPPPLPPVPGVPLPSVLPLGGFDSWAKKLLKKTKQPKGYTPSATSLAFGITGKASKAGAKSGFGLRPITAPKKSKKKLRF